MCGYTYKAPHCRYDTVVPLDSHCWNSTSCINLSQQGELIRSQAEVISMLKWVARGPLAAAAACIVYKFTWVSRITQPLNLKKNMIIYKEEVVMMIIQLWELHLEIIRRCQILMKSEKGERFYLICNERPKHAASCFR